MNNEKITTEGDKITLEDLGSTNGTFVNGTKIKKTLIPAEGLDHEVRVYFRKYHQRLSGRPFPGRHGINLWSAADIGLKSSFC